MDLVRNHASFILNRGSRPEAVLFSYRDYLRIQQTRESEVLAL
jgi:hypothetical protein